MILLLRRLLRGHMIDRYGLEQFQKLNSVSGTGCSVFSLLRRRLCGQMRDRTRLLSEKLRSVEAKLLWLINFREKKCRESSDFDKHTAEFGEEKIPYCCGLFRELTRLMRREKGHRLHSFSFATRFLRGVLLPLIHLKRAPCEIISTLPPRGE